MSYGLGHDQASGGALPTHVWNLWIQEIGFGPEMVVETPGLPDEDLR